MNTGISLSDLSFLRITEAHYQQFRSHLLQTDGNEHKLRAWLGCTTGGLTVWQLQIPDESDYEISAPYAVQVAEDWGTQEELAYEAARPDGVLEAHSHPFCDQAEFSEQDNVEDALTASCWRMFVHPEGIFCRFVAGMAEDGFRLQVFESSTGTWRDIPELRIVGESGVRRIRSHRVPEPTLQGPEKNDRYVRVDVLRSEDERQRVTRAHVVVVGAGGLGWALARGVRTLGVDSLTIVDDDRLEVLNLNRLFGATEKDVTMGRLKVEVLRELLIGHDPEAPVNAVAELFPGPRCLAAVESADLVVAGVDSDLARFDLIRHCVRHLIPVIDCGTSFWLDEFESRERERAGHVWFYRPGQACWCDMGLEERSLPTDSLRDSLRQAGYVDNRPTESSGSIQAFNELIASVAVSLGEAFLCGRPLRANLVFCRQKTLPTYSLTVEHGHLTKSGRCPLCGPSGFEGRGGSPFEVETRESSDGSRTRLMNLLRIASLSSDAQELPAPQAPADADFPRPLE